MGEVTKKSRMQGSKMRHKRQLIECIPLSLKRFLWRGECKIHAGITNLGLSCFVKKIILGAEIGSIQRRNLHDVLRQVSIYLKYQ